MWMFMNNLSATVKMLRKQYGLTQEELSLKSGVGLRFVRDLEQGKETLRLDKVNQLYSSRLCSLPVSSIFAICSSHRR